MITLQILALMTFPMLLLIAAISDIRAFIIPNHVNLALVAAWPFAVLMCNVGLVEASFAVGLSVVMLILCFCLFAAGWLGGGDAKLIAAVTLWVGPVMVLPFVFKMVFAGASLAIILFMLRRFPLPVFAVKFDWVTSLYERKRDIPYGVAIAIGGIAVWPMTPYFPFQ